MRWMILALTLVSSACGSESLATVAPTPVPGPAAPKTPQLAGRWTGRMEMLWSATNSRVGVTVDVSIAQRDRDIGGEWVIASGGNDAAGVITGSVSGFEPGGEFVGTFTWESSGVNDPPGVRSCKGVANVRGDAVVPMRLTASRFNFNGTCADAFSDVVWTLTPLNQLF